MRHSIWIRRAVTIAALAAFVAGGTSVAQAEVTALNRPLLTVGNVAHRTNGFELGNNPSLRPGRSIDILAGGFAPSARIGARIACRTAPVGSFRADARGAVRFRFVVPADLAPGRYTLSLSGPVRPAAGKSVAPSGNLEVTVPLVEYFRFTVPGPAARTAGC